MENFWAGYERFKKVHNSIINIWFHLLTSILQIIFTYELIETMNPMYFLMIIGIPFITDGIGHLLQGNFFYVVLESKKNNNTNSANVNGFYNFLYKIMLPLEIVFFS